MLCIATIVDRIHVHHVVHYKIIRTYHILLQLLTAPMYGQLQPHLRTGHGNSDRERELQNQMRVIHCDVNHSRKACFDDT